jgi:putative endonuclease
MKRKTSSYIVYMLECKDGSLYTGITTDIVRRFDEHKKGVGGHYTRSRKVKRVVYTEKRRDRSSASKREAQIKRLSRIEKKNLIRSGDQG